MEVVYCKEKKWYSCGFYISETDKKTITISRLKEIKNISDVKDVDEYIHVDKYLKMFSNRTIISNFIKDRNIDDMYIKHILPLKKNITVFGICNTCINTCKSEKVIGCSRFDSGSGKHDLKKINNVPLEGGKVWQI